MFKESDEKSKYPLQITVAVDSHRCALAVFVAFNFHVHRVNTMNSQILFFNGLTESISLPGECVFCVNQAVRCKATVKCIYVNVSTGRI